MKTLSKSKSDNLGGILNLYLVPADNIAINVENSTTGIHTIGFKNTELNWHVECSAETVEYIEKENTEFGTSIYDIELSGFIPNDTPEIALNLKYLKSRPFIIIFEDQNEYLKMVGGEDCPLRLKKSFQTQSEISKLKGYQISFTGQSFDESVFINNPF